MITGLALLLTVVISFVAGMLALYGLMVYRIWTNNDGADDSNATNPVRVLNHLILHKFDFKRMYILTERMLFLLRQHDFDPVQAFWYWDKDEFSEVVKTRPPTKLVEPPK